MTEFQVIRREIRLRPAQFIARLSSHLQQDGECRLWTGAGRGGREGSTYGKINFWVNGRSCSFDVHRIFLVLKLRRPIRRGHEAGHFQCHKHRCVVHVEEQTVNYNRKEANGRAKEKRASSDCPF